MPKTAIDLALEQLLEIPPLLKARGESAAGNRHVARCVERLVRLTAAFCNEVERKGACETLRIRADLVKKETAPGTLYDERRRKFIALFNEDEMAEIGLAALRWDFGAFKTDFGPPYVGFNADIQVVQEVSAEYRTYVPHLKAAKACGPTCGPWPLPGPESSSKRPSKRSKEPLENDVSPSPEGSENPNDVARAWIGQLQKLKLLADQEHFWGSYLILLCRDLRDPNKELAFMPMFLKALENQFDDTLAAIQIAAVDVTIPSDQTDDSAFRPAKEFLGEQFDTYGKLTAALERNPSIRNRKPSKQRLEIHAGDWLKFLNERAAEQIDSLDLSAELVDDAVKNIEARKAAERAKKSKR